MPIGEPIPLADAVARVTGQVPYMANFQLEGMLVAAALRSPYPHARILSLDASAAEKIPGVAAVLTAADFGKPGAPQLLTGSTIKDHPALAKDKVLFAGEPVALVAAENRAIAAQALQTIQVRYAELPAAIQIDEAIQPGAPSLHADYPDNCFIHAKLRHGDLEAGFATAEVIVEETFTSPYAQHTYLETHITAAQWKDGRLTVWTGSQAPSMLQKALAGMFQLPEEAVRVIVPPLGGGYGGKGQFSIEPMVAALAWKLDGRPVKLTLRREEEFVNVVKHAARFTFKTGVKRDGSITARQVTAHWGAGAYADISPVLIRAYLSGNLCRCGSYVNILKAVHRASHR